MVSDRPEVLLQIHLDCWVGTGGGGVDEKGGRVGHRLGGRQRGDPQAGS